MVDVGELQALTRSIGEHSLNAIGQENLSGMQATLDARTLVCTLQLALRSNSSRSQLDAISALGEVEELFFDDAVLAFQFVEKIETGAERQLAQLQYSYS